MTQRTSHFYSINDRDREPSSQQPAHPIDSRVSLSFVVINDRSRPNQTPHFAELAEPMYSMWLVASLPLYQTRNSGYKQPGPAFKGMCIQYF